MIHIAICDDEKDFVAHLNGLINQYDTTIDLIFLDIRMRLVNGLRAAERIRQMDEKAPQG